MPIYEFHCKECRSEFKTLRARDALSEVTCPACGTGRVARLLSVTAQPRTTDDACAMPGNCCALNPEACACRN